MGYYIVNYTERRVTSCHVLVSTGRDCNNSILIDVRPENFYPDMLCIYLIHPCHAPCFQPKRSRAPIRLPPRPITTSTPEDNPSNRPLQHELLPSVEDLEQISTSQQSNNYPESSPLPLIRKQDAKGRRPHRSLSESWAMRTLSSRESLIPPAHPSGSPEAPVPREDAIIISSRNKQQLPQLISSAISQNPDRSGQSKGRIDHQQHEGHPERPGVRHAPQAGHSRMTSSGFRCPICEGPLRNQDLGAAVRQGDQNQQPGPSGTKTTLKTGATPAAASLSGKGVSAPPRTGGGSPPPVEIRLDVRGNDPTSASRSPNKQPDRLPDLECDRGHNFARAREGHVNLVRSGRKVRHGNEKSHLVTPLLLTWLRTRQLTQISLVCIRLERMVGALPATTTVWSEPAVPSSTAGM